MGAEVPAPRSLPLTLNPQPYLRSVSWLHNFLGAPAPASERGASMTSALKPQNSKSRPHGSMAPGGARLSETSRHAVAPVVPSPRRSINRVDLEALSAFKDSPLATPATYMVHPPSALAAPILTLGFLGTSDRNHIGGYVVADSSPAVRRRS